MLAIAGCIVVSWPCPLAMYPPVCSPLWPPAGLRRETENKQTKRTEQWFKIKCKKWEKKEKNKRCKHTQSQNTARRPTPRKPTSSDSFEKTTHQFYCWLWC